ncbi:hypothetical protein HZH68_003916 [Vespula germanica]|uniref:Uncharacterized protein n=1 Tax=Vespula germanica TaxID=30212 RepID=A0A834NHR0_VESGE|nr:hypothetical protein HZH68_003916 [Vespula germanica]
MGIQCRTRAFQRLTGCTGSDAGEQDIAVGGTTRAFQRPIKRPARLRSLEDNWTRIFLKMAPYFTSYWSDAVGKRIDVQSQTRAFQRPLERLISWRKQKMFIDGATRPYQRPVEQPARWCSSGDINF